MTIREPLLTPEYRDYFNETMALWLKQVEERERVFLENPAKYVRLDRAYYQAYDLSCDLLQGRYSQGDSLSALAPAYPELIRKWERYLQYPVHEPFVFDAPITADRMYLDNYTDALRLLSWAYIFDLDEAYWLRLVSCIGNAGKDLLLERLILRRLPWLAAERPVATQLVYPKAYQPLYEALDASPTDQPALLTTFLNGWYKHMKKAMWHGNHKQGSFFGYWAWEAAGVTLAFNLDDTTYRDLPYYPKDAVAYSRTR